MWCILLLACGEGTGPPASMLPVASQPASPDNPTPPSPPATDDISCDAVLTDFEIGCAACHGQATLGGLSLLDLSALVGTPSAGSPLPLITAGDASQSYLWHKVNGTHEDVGGNGTLMPPSGDPFAPVQVDRLAQWIDGGALCGVAPEPEPPDPTTRQLSNIEFANTLETLLDVRPEALDLLPPDGHGFTYDRVVASQTISRAHLDAYFAIAEEAAASVLTPDGLAQLSPACVGVELPPAHPSGVFQVPGSEFALGPEWAVGLDPNDPSVGTTLYAPDPTASASVVFPADGRYRLGFEIDTDHPVQQVELRFNGALMDTVPANGPTVATFTVDATAGPGVFDAHLITVPEEHNLGVSFSGLTVEGPLDETDASGRLPCAEGLIEDLGSQLFRRPLTLVEQDRMRGLYTDSEGLTAFRQVLVGLIANPHTLYLVEVGTETQPGLYELDGWEKAARLSYAICEGPPDAELREAAVLGTLDADGMETHARRLLASPCGEEGVRRFVEQWLHLHELEDLNKSPSAFPGFDDATRAGLAAESERYIFEMVYPRQAGLGEFFTSQTAWPDPRSAWLMNLSVSAQEETPLPPERGGILTHPAVLAATAGFDSTSPVERGVYVLEQLLCDALPPPPPNLNVAPPIPDPSLTTRERWAQHSDDAACSSCHLLIDPVGFAFEGFDGVGQFRTTENGLPIDTSGGVPSLGIVDGSLDGAVEVSMALATSDRLSECFAKQWLRGSLGRLDHPDDGVSVDAVGQIAATDSMLEAIVALVRTPAFSHRFGDAP